MKLTIECAHTGNVLALAYDSNFDQFRADLSLMTSIPVAEQILLCGPPYKPLKSIFSDAEQLRDKRIFLYDKRVCIGSLTAVHLTHIPIDEPKFDNQTEKPAESLFDQSSTPKMDVFIKCMRATLAREVQFEAFMKAHYGNIQKFVDKQKVQLDSLVAAIDNVYETFQSLFGHYSEYKIKMIDILSKHKSLLDSFDSNFDVLSKCNLHPYLLTLLHDGDGQQLSSRPLIDTIDPERMRSIRMVSQENYFKMEKFSKKLESLFDAVNQRVAGLRSSVILSKTLECSLKIVFNDTANQEFKVQSIRNDYQELSTSAAMKLLDKEGVAILQRHVDNYLRCEHEWPGDHHEKKIHLRDLAKVCEQSSTDIENLVNGTMRNIAALQTELQLKVANDVDHLRRLTTTSANENIRQLEIIANLPKIQIVLLQEIIRRQHYQIVVNKKIESFKEEMKSLRSHETLERKEFLTQHGSLLPPFFFEFLPSLKFKPDFVDVTTSAVHNPDVSVSLLTVEDVLDFVETLPSVLDELKVEFKNSLQQNLVVDRAGDQISSVDSTNATVCLPSIVERESKSVNTSVMSFQNTAIPADNAVQAALNDQLLQLEKENQMLKLQISELQSILDAQQLNTSSIATSGSHMQSEEKRVEDIKQSADVEIQKQEEIIIKSRHPSLDQLISWLQYVHMILEPNRLTLSQLNQSVDFPLYSIPNTIDGNAGTVGDEFRSLTDKIMKLHTDHLRVTQYSVLSFLNFEIGNLALFMPTEDNPMHQEKVPWVAFSCNCPHRYLAQESLVSFLRKRKYQVGYIIGKIWKIEEKVVDENAIEFNLPLGSKYYVVYAKPVKFPSISSPSSSSTQQSV